MIRTIPALLAILILVGASPSPSPAPSQAHAAPAMPRGPHPTRAGVPAPASSDVIIPPAGAPGGAPAGGPGATFELGVWTIHASAVDANFKSGEFSTQN